MIKKIFFFSFFILFLEVLDVLFSGLKASPVAWILQFLIKKRRKFFCCIFFLRFWSSNPGSRLSPDPDPYPYPASLEMLDPDPDPYPLVCNAYYQIAPWREQLYRDKSYLRLSLPPVLGRLQVLVVGLGREPHSFHLSKQVNKLIK